MATPMNGIYVLQGIDPAQIAAAPVGVKVVDLYDDNGNLFSPAQVAQMESGGGSVIGYFSIGEAENYRSYWSSLPSSVLGPQDPSWPGDYQVAYWTPQWLSVAENYIQTMINQGYQGAYFDVVDEAFTSWAKQNAPNGDPQGAMVTLIQELASFARAQNPNFQIWINSSGAEPMLTNTALINTINGVFEEQLFYQSATQATNSADLNYNVSLLDNVTKAGKPVVAIEYVSSATAVSNVETSAAADGFGYYIANPNLNLNGVDTQGFTTGSTSGSGSTTGTGSGSTSGAGSTPTTAPTVTITSVGGATSSATQTIAGTVDVADAGSTVKIFDGTTQIGSATVASNGTWSAKVTLSGQGSNVITATDTNSVGKGTSNAVTFNYQPVTQSTTPAAPTVAITSVGGTVASAGVTVAGTVDLADAGSTVKVLDGTTQIGSATVAGDGTWSANVTLASQGSNVITATDTNATGTGTSNAVTFNYQPPAQSNVAAAPTVTIADTSLDVTGHGGTVDLGVSVSAPSDATNVSLTITGLPRYETISDGLGDTFRGKSITLTEEQVNSGLTLTSNYRWYGHPVATLSITATDTVAGVTNTSAAQTITVTDPPPTTTTSATPPATGKLALLMQSIAGGFDNQAGSAPDTWRSSSHLSQLDSFLTQPQHS